MPINYAASDLLHRFTVNEAALLWCDVGKITEEHIPQFMIIKSAIVEAIKAGKLKAEEIPKKIVEHRIRGSLYDIEEPDYEKAIVTRKALIKWAEKNNQKPKFLFPEIRTENDNTPTGTLITQYNITADHVVVTPTQKPVTQKNKPAPLMPINTERESEMHRFIERVYDALCSELGRSPTSTQVYNAIRTRHEKFDTDDIIQEVTAHKISWASSHGNEQDMQKSTVRNIVSKIRTAKK